jgi:hypothetical protein
LFFINILRTLDTYVLQYLDKYKQEIENELSTNYKDTRSLASFKYVNVIKKVEKSLENTQYKQINDNQELLNSQSEGTYILSDTSVDKQWEVTMKSYLDKKIIYDFIKKRNRYQKDPVEHHQFMCTKHIFTFNISNIYFGTNNLIPLVKTNRLETNL